jgi:hypothetical protein
MKADQMCSLGIDVTARRLLAMQALEEIRGQLKLHRVIELEDYRRPLAISAIISG